MVAPLQKFSSQAAPELLAAFRDLARKEGRPFHALLDEAMRGYLDRRQYGHPRRHVAEAFASSVEEFDELYRELAK